MVLSYYLHHIFSNYSLEEEVERPRRSISDQINVVICLINGRDPRNNTLLTNLSRHKQYLRENGDQSTTSSYSPRYPLRYLLIFSFLSVIGITAITVVTHYDKIAEAERDGVLLAASQATGSPINKTFFIANYIIDDCERYVYYFWSSILSMLLIPLSIPCLALF